MKREKTGQQGPARSAHDLRCGERQTPEGSSKTADREGALQSSTPAIIIWGVLWPSTRRASSRVSYGLACASGQSRHRGAVSLL